MRYHEITGKPLGMGVEPCWIRADGTIFPVPFQQHWREAAKELGGVDSTSAYTAAFDAGWVRVDCGLLGRHYNLTWTTRVSKKALRKLLRITRADPPEGYVMADVYNDYAKADVAEHKQFHHFNDFTRWMSVKLAA